MLRLAKISKQRDNEKRIFGALLLELMRPPFLHFVDLPCRAPNGVETPYGAKRISYEYGEPTESSFGIFK